MMFDVHYNEFTTNLASASEAKFANYELKISRHPAHEIFADYPSRSSYTKDGISGDCDSPDTVSAVIKISQRKFKPLRKGHQALDSKN
jgi:hypothetical protein